MVEPENIVLRLLQYFNNQTELADFCMVNRSTVTHWKTYNRIPPWHVEILHKKTGLERWELCPEHFKKEDEDEA